MRIRPIAVLALLASVGAAAHSQTPYPPEANLRFEVWDGTQWTNQVNAHPGDRIEWRAVISSVGTRTDLLGLAECLCQPIIPNADNDGPVMDELGPWRNGGASGWGIPGSLLSESEGDSGDPLSSYGRVGFGYIGTTATGSNTMTSFRHSNGSNGAPPGEWLRIAGNYVSQWPVTGAGPGWSTADSNRLLRGINAGQVSRLSSGFPNGTNPNWRGGTQDLVVFRQALIIGDAPADRTVEVSAAESPFRRAQMLPGTTDNRRYISWYDQENQLFSAAYRTCLTITPAIALVTVPAPGACGGIVCGVWAVRRRRTA
jgi:hypothetical protein